MMVVLKDIIFSSWEILLEAGPFIIIGILLAGLIHIFLPTERINRYLGKPGIWSVIKAALIGAPLPLCSCGVIPVASGLRKQGASKGATASFLISTPETGIDSVAISVALLDLPLVIIRPVAAVVTAIAGGFGIDLLDKKDNHVQKEEKESCGCCCEGEKKEKPDVISRIREAFRFAFVEIMDDIGPLLLIGIILSGIITVALPDNFFGGAGGGFLMEAFMMLAIGLPMYICATASTPIAAAMLVKGLSPGAALIFLLAGPATNIATMLVVGRQLGRRSLLIYTSSIIVISIIIGAIVNFMYFKFGWTFLTREDMAHSDGLEIISVFSAVILLIIMILSSIKNIRKRITGKITSKELSPERSSESTVI